MLYHGTNPILKIVGVEHLQWNGGTFTVSPREYSALAFRIRGSAEIGANGEIFSLNSNSILYLPQNMGYTANYTDTEMIVVHFLAEHDDGRPELYPFGNSQELFRAFFAIQELWENKEPAFPVYAIAQFYNILGILYKKETKNTLPSHFLQAVSHINTHYRNANLDIPSICTEAGISETAFRQLFKKHYRKTPVEYITDLRVEYARTLIAGDVPVERAAEQCGFNDPKYFARVVKKRFGCTPRSFKAYGK